MSGSIPPYPGVLLRTATPWMTGEAVVAVQQKLQALGVGSGDGQAGEAVLPGVYSAPTAAAVLTFQRRAGLRADGIIGRQTWERLFSTGPGALPADTALPLPPVAPPLPAPSPASAASPGPAAGPATPANDADFAKALPVVLRFEGGYVNDPADPGGATNKGITFRVYDAYRRAQGLPTRDVRQISDAEVAAIYRQQYWAATRCDALPWPTSMLQFDTAVNMGVGRASQFLRQSLGLPAAGRIDDPTLRMVAGCDKVALAEKYCGIRERFYRNLIVARPAMQKFLKGWLSRLDTLRRMAGLPARESVDDLDDALEPTLRVPDDVELDLEVALDPNDPAHAPLLAAIAEVERLAPGGDAAALESAIATLKTQLAATGIVLPEARAMSLLRAVRGARRFDALRQLSEALVASGVAAPTVRQEYAQALIENGQIVPAIEMLEHVLATNPPAPVRADITALLGRCWKQLFVGGGGATALRNAIGQYEAALHADSGALRLWPTINLVALMTRARREGIDPVSSADPLALAGGILAGATPGDGPWELATQAEANIALGRWPEAEQQVRAFLDHPATDAFAIASLLRQLTEIWQFGITPGAPGGDIIATLRAALMQREGGSVTLTPWQIRELSSTPRETLQRVLGEPGIVTWNWMQTGLARAAAVGVIRRPDGRGVGTGFLVRGSELDPRLGDEIVLLTNAHVLSPDPADRPAVDAADAEVLFEAAPGAPIFRVRALPWHSPVEVLDACIAQLDPAPTLAPCPLSDAALPMPPAPGAQVEAANRLYIIGHPRGGQLAFSIQDNLLLDHEGPPQGRPGRADRVLVHYRTPTEPGSSGSPVFEALGWRVVALHHAGGDLMRRLNGQPGTYAANEGIWIGSIRAAMARG